jgi:Bardet-Biedl syndrome 5 protein
MSNDDIFLWQDWEIRFDIPTRQLEFRKGEQLLDELSSVEDTKGRDAERGLLQLTNLRIIWQSHARSRVNVTIGLGCITGFNVKIASSRLRGGTTQALLVSCRVPGKGATSTLSAAPGSTFEFIFTSLVKASPKIFLIAQSALKAYESSRTYREAKLRSAIVTAKDLILLPGERIFTRLEGIWNLSSDQGNLGILITTNFRFVWFATFVENFNVSIPYSQIKNVELRETKNYPALVIQTGPRAGGLLLGFKIDDTAFRQKVFTEIVALREAAFEKPNYGVHVDTTESTDKSTSANSVSSSIRISNSAVNEDEKVIIDDKSSGTGEARNDALALYYTGGGDASSGVDGSRSIIFSQLLGLAIEQPPAGLTLERLWSAQ